MTRTVHRVCTLCEANCGLRFVEGVVGQSILSGVWVRLEALA